MQTLVCRTPNEFEFIETPYPERKAGEVIVSVRHIGVCGTDYHAFRGTQPYFEYPRILGHEVVGVVHDAGTSAFAVGEQVTVMPYLSCGHCFACRKGKGNACGNLQVIGCHVDGAMRDYVAIPQDYLVSAKGLTANQTVMIEPMSIGLHAVHRAQVGPGDWVVVLGAGPIGLACMKFAKLAGATVVAVDLNAERLAFCKRWAQVDHALDGNADPIAAVAQLTGGDLASQVIDATGNAKSMMGSFNFAAHGATVVYVSLVRADITFSDPEFHKKELTLKGSRAATIEEFAEVADAMRAGHLDSDPFISHRAPWGTAIEAFQGWLDPANGVIKAVIDFPERA